MIHDQAHELRALIRQVQAEERRWPHSPRLVVVSSGTAGTGASCIATSLAFALAARGTRTVLVDADLDGAKVTALCQAQPTHSVADVLSGTVTAAEATVPLQGKLSLLGGLWGSNLILDCSPTAQLQLIEQLRALEETDCVVIDVGCGRSHVVSDFWQNADLVLAVTTPDNATLVQTYSAIKIFSARSERCDVRLIVNRAANREVAHDVSARLSASAEKFLARGIGEFGWLPFDAEVGLACRERRPFAVRSPECPASRAIEQMAAALEKVVDRSGQLVASDERLVAA